MKNDELLDLISELKVDDAFVDEALGEQDGAPVRVYAGSSKRSPMRIAAPIAACLAVAAAAGFVFVNISRGKLAAGPAASIEESIEESSEIDETSEPEITEDSLHNPQINIPDNWTMFPSYDPTCVEECKGAVVSQFGYLLPTGVHLAWQANSFDVDYDGVNELLLCPRVDGKSIKGVGVCVFKAGKNGAEYVGTFGGEFTTMNIDNFYNEPKAEDKFTYYFNSNDEDEKCVDSIQKLYFDTYTNTVQEETYLRVEKAYDDWGGTAYRNGEEISADELMSEWENSGIEVLPAMSGAAAHTEASECVQLLVGKYDISDSPEALHRNVTYADVNGDGADETVIQFRNCEQLPAIYVFSADGKLIGELDPDCERGEHYITGLGDLISQTLTVDIFKYDDGEESFYYYISTHVDTWNSGMSQAAQKAVNKIIVNEDGTLDTVKIIESGSTRYERIYRVNGEDVPANECHDEYLKYPDEITFVW